MATMTLQFLLRIAGTDIDTETINPNEKDVTVTGEGLRRTVSLPAEDYTTLDAGELTPVWWFFMNVHDTADLILGWGNQDIVTLSPGEMSFLRSGVIPYAKGSGAASKLLYAVYA